MLEQLTYVQIAERLNISSEGARAMVKRNRLPRAHDKHGKTLVAIDLDELQLKPLPVWPPRRQPVNDVVATLKTRIEQLEAELAAEQQCSAGHRAHYEHERERATKTWLFERKMLTVRFIALALRVPQVMEVNPSIPAKTVPEVIAH